MNKLQPVGMGRPVRIVALTLALCFAASPVGAQAKKNGPDESKPVHVSSPALMLLRSTAVQAELLLTAQQTKSVREMLDDSDKTFFGLRDVSAEEGGEVLRSLTMRTMIRMQALLKPDQYERLEQIILQAQGAEALLLVTVATKLGMTPEQRQQAEAVYREVRDAVQDLAKRADGTNRKEMQEAATKLLADGRQRIVGVLTDEQKNKWNQFQGKPFDLSLVKSVAFKAPEIDGGSDWINSEPLTLAKLRGRVVVVHFWTFG